MSEQAVIRLEATFPPTVLVGPARILKSNSLLGYLYPKGSKKQVKMRFVHRSLAHLLILSSSSEEF
jgi:hypothetical protein